MRIPDKLPFDLSRRIVSPSGKPLTCSDVRGNALPAQNPTKIFLRDTVPITIMEDSFLGLPTYQTFEVSLDDYNTFFRDLPSGDPDVGRFNRKLKELARDKLKKGLINPGQMAGRVGGKIVGVPVPSINIPNLVRGKSSQGGVGGFGEGDKTPRKGQTIGKGDDGNDPNGPGDEEGDHGSDLFVPFSRDEIAQMLIDKLGLPNLDPKGKQTLISEAIKWTATHHTGTFADIPETLANIIRSNISAGKIDPDNLNIDDLVVSPNDIVYQSYTETEQPEAGAAIIYMMDVSGSMTEREKEAVRTCAFYLSTIIQRQFGVARANLRGETYTADDFGVGVKEIFITHDARARERTEYEFYTTRESGGTVITSAFDLAEKIVDTRFPFDDWNVYMFYFGDGGNIDSDNEKLFHKINALSRKTNALGYIQTDSQMQSYSSSCFPGLDERFGMYHKHIRLARIEEPTNTAFTTAITKMLEDRN